MIDENQIPVLGSTSGIEKLNLSPEEFFVLSRINGSITIKQINQMVGFSIDKTLGFMQKFLENNIVSFKQTETKAPKTAPTQENKSGVQILDQEDQDPDLSQISRALRSRILLMSQDLDKMNFFEILEVTPSADAAEIHANYLRLVKEMHPDSLRVKDAGHYKRKLETIFGKIQEAYQEIHPDNKRAAYLHELMEGRRTKKDGNSKSKSKYEYKVPKKDVELKLADADSQYEMGVKEEKRGNLQAALNFYQMAMNLNTSRKAYEDAYHRVRKLMREGF
jgi:hypothetical protein